MVVTLRDGQRTLSSCITVAFPSPKWARGSLHEAKLPPALELPGSGRSVRYYRDSCSYTQIGSDQFDQDPVIPRHSLVHEQGRVFVQRDYSNVNRTIVIEVSEDRSPVGLHGL